MFFIRTTRKSFISGVPGKKRDIPEKNQGISNLESHKMR